MVSNQIKFLYGNWLEQKAKIVLTKKTNQFANELKIEIQKIMIKNLRNRWGSVTEKGVLNLNLNLLKAPQKIIDYIIIHELCHFRIKKHSYQFWDMLRKIMPNYNEYVIWLGRNASSLVE